MNINERSAPRVCFMLLPGRVGPPRWSRGHPGWAARAPEMVPVLEGGRPWGDITVSSFGGTPAPAQSRHRDCLPGGPSLPPSASSC